MSDFSPFQKKIAGRSFRVQLADTTELEEKVFNLRYKIFHREWQGLSLNALGNDRDQYDDYCDHLIVIDETTDEVVGTYRLLPYSRVKNTLGLYSETEFDLSRLYAANLKLLEIGRACIAPDYRDGHAINLLWAGLAAYMQVNELEYMCGCGSLNKTDNAHTAAQIYQYCLSHHRVIQTEWRVTPHAKNMVPGFVEDVALENTSILKRQLPALVRAYLRVGCKIGGIPAYDPDFQVIDFLIILEFLKLAKGAQRFLLM